MLTLDSYITDDEIKKTLFSIPHKAFGFDGYTSLLFKRSWDIISKDFIATMRYFFDSSTLPRCVNATRISLISKIETLMIMNNFRRISCSNVFTNAYLKSLWVDWKRCFWMLLVLLRLPMFQVGKYRMSSCWLKSLYITIT
jgi:hypothetical protein